MNPLCHVDPLPDLNFYGQASDLKEVFVLFKRICFVFGVSGMLSNEYFGSFEYQKQNFLNKMKVFISATFDKINFPVSASLASSSDSFSS